MKVKVLEKLTSLVKEKKKPGKKLTVVTVAVLITVLAGSSIGYQMISAKTAGTDDVKKEMPQMPGENQGLLEEGTTGMGTVAQMPEFDVNTVVMQVEEVYAYAGNVVNKGDALFKITEESMTAITEYYEEAIAEAKDTLETAELAYENGRLEAEYTKQEALLHAE